MCNNTVTKDPTTPQVCRYTTLWNVKCFQSNNWKQDDFCNNCLTTLYAGGVFLVLPLMSAPCTRLQVGQILAPPAPRLPPLPRNVSLGFCIHQLLKNNTINEENSTQTLFNWKRKVLDPIERQQTNNQSINTQSAYIETWPALYK